MMSNLAPFWVPMAGLVVFNLIAQPIIRVRSRRARADRR